MKMSAGVEWAVHCCVVLWQAEEPGAGAAAGGVPRRLADLPRQAPPAALAGRAGRLDRGPGRRLRADPRGADISVLDVVLAIEGDEPAFRCTEIRQNGPFPATAQQCRRPCGIARAMYAAEDAWRASLGGVTIADLAAGVEEDNGPQTFAACAAGSLTPELGQPPAAAASSWARSRRSPSSTRATIQSGRGGRGDDLPSCGAGRPGRARRIARRSRPWSRWVSSLLVKYDTARHRRSDRRDEGPVVPVEDRRHQKFVENGDPYGCPCGLRVDREVGCPAQQPHRLLSFAPPVELTGAGAGPPSGPGRTSDGGRPNACGEAARGTRLWRGSGSCPSWSSGA